MVNYSHKDQGNIRKEQPITFTPVENLWKSLGVSAKPGLTNGHLVPHEPGPSLRTCVALVRCRPGAGRAFCYCVALSLPVCFQVAQACNGNQGSHRPCHTNLAGKLGQNSNSKNHLWCTDSLAQFPKGILQTHRGSHTVACSEVPVSGTPKDPRPTSEESKLGILCRSIVSANSIHNTSACWLAACIRHLQRCTNSRRAMGRKSSTVFPTGTCWLSLKNDLILKTCRTCNTLYVAMKNDRTHLHVIIHILAKSNPSSFKLHHIKRMHDIIR